MGFFGDILKTVAGPIIGSVGNLLGIRSQERGAQGRFDANWALQERFARHGIRWRTEDAVAAGLHPLAALGMQPAQGSPVYVGETGGDMYRELGRLGQNITRAISSMTTEEERELKKVQLGIEKARLDNMNLKNVGLRKAIEDSEGGLSATSSGDAHLSDAYGIPGQTRAVVKGVERQPGRVTLKPAEQTMSQTMGVEEGLHPMEMVSIDKNGFLVFTPTQRMTEMMENNLDFKVRYYGMKLGDYYRGFEAAFKGSKSEAAKKWMREWKKVLPDPGKGFYWQYHTAKGAFRRTPVAEKQQYEGRTGPERMEQVERKLWRLYRLAPEVLDIIGP